MRDLIERLEKLPGSDRQIDGAIEKSLFGEGPYGTVNTPYYTGSIDAALTLWAIGPENGFQVGIADDGKTAYAFVGRNEYAHGATPAIALCIAAMKVRLSKGTSQLPTEKPGI